MEIKRGTLCFLVTKDSVEYVLVLSGRSKKAKKVDSSVINYQEKDLIPLVQNCKSIAGCWREHSSLIIKSLAREIFNLRKDLDNLSPILTPRLTQIKQFFGPQS